jgi:hypothetical protein
MLRDGGAGVYFGVTVSAILGRSLRCGAGLDRRAFLKVFEAFISLAWVTGKEAKAQSSERTSQGQMAIVDSGVDSSFGKASKFQLMNEHQSPQEFSIEFHPG